MCWVGYNNMLGSSHNQIDLISIQIDSSWPHYIKQLALDTTLDELTQREALPK